jgi:hypothetical protein
LGKGLEFSKKFKTIGADMAVVGCVTKCMQAAEGSIKDLKKLITTEDFAITILLAVSKQSLA